MKQHRAQRTVNAAPENAIAPWSLITGFCLRSFFFVLALLLTNLNICNWKLPFTIDWERFSIMQTATVFIVHNSQPHKCVTLASMVLAANPLAWRTECDCFQIRHFSSIFRFAHILCSFRIHYFDAEGNLLIINLSVFFALHHLRRWVWRTPMPQVIIDRQFVVKNRC